MIEQAENSLHDRLAHKAMFGRTPNKYSRIAILLVPSNAWHLCASYGHGQLAGESKCAKCKRPIIKNCRGRPVIDGVTKHYYMMNE